VPLCIHFLFSSYIYVGTLRINLGLQVTGFILFEIIRYLLDGSLVSIPHKQEGKLPFLMIVNLNVLQSF